MKKYYKAKPSALPLMQEVKGELYTNTIKDSDGTLVSTGEYYLRNYYTTFDADNLEIMINYIDYKVDESTLEELPEQIIDLSDSNLIKEGKNSEGN